MTSNQAQTAKPTVVEAIDLLDGYEEDKIEAFFGAPIDGLRFIKQVRALRFIQLRREGVEDGTAFEQTQKYTQADLIDFFAVPGEDEVDPTEDETSDQGKDTEPEL